MSDKEMLFCAQAYRALTKATAEISNKREDQKRFEIIDWLVKQAEKAENYREALEFYADKEIYEQVLIREAQYDADGVCSSNDEYDTPIIYFDKGEIARKALEGEE